MTAALALEQPDALCAGLAEFDAPGEKESDGDGDADSDALGDNEKWPEGETLPLPVAV